MEQLTTLDAGFLAAEDADRHVSLAIGGLAILEGPIPDPAALMSTLGERMRRCPRFEQRLRTRVFDLGAPTWVDDPGFDLARHVRRIALPRPGGDRELFRLAADVISRRLDRDRPMWEIWIIEGLSDNRWAMLIKIHHCMADGIAATHMLAGLCDEGINGGLGSRTGGAKEQLADNVPLTAQGTGSPSMWGALWKAPVHAARIIRGAAEIATGLLRPATTTLNGPITNMRRYSAARVPLADIEQVCRVFDVTVNDVALAAITESYRNLILQRGEQPLAHTLRTLVPVSMRSVDAFDKTDNRLSVMLPYLPVDEQDPVKRLRIIHSRLARTKSYGQRQAGSTLVSIANRAPFPLTAWAVRFLSRLPQRGVVTLTTNVPGPRQQLKIMGRRVLSVLPMPPIAMQLRTGVAMLSYAEDLFFGILADYESIDDADTLSRGIESAIARLVARSKKRRPVRDRRGLTVVVNA